MSIGSGFFPNPAEAAAVALNSAHQLGIISRDAVRVQTVPDHRKADTLTRNFIPAFLIPLIMEGSFRIVDTFYTMPLLANALELKKLGYDKMPEPLRRRMVSRLVTPNSVFIVPRVLQNTDIPQAQGEERTKLQALTQHLQKKLCPTDYLEQLVHNGQLAPADLEKINTSSTKLLEGINIDQLLKKGMTSYRDDPALKSKLGKELLELGQQQWAEHAPEQQKKLLSHVRMCIDSKITQEMIKRIQKTGAWQNLLLSAATSFIFYGLITNLMEVKVVRPWQKRLVAERGTASEVVAPCYLATIPWLITVFGGLGDKAPQFLKKMSHLNRFLTVSAAAIGSYFTTAGLLVKYKLSGPPPKCANKTQPSSSPFQTSPANPPQHHTQAHTTSFGIASFNNNHKPSYPYPNMHPFPQATTPPQTNGFQSSHPFPISHETPPQAHLPAQPINTFQPQQNMGSPVSAFTEPLFADRQKYFP